MFDARLDPDHNVPDLLARIGLTPRDIDVVVQSHLHFDHAGGLEHLTHAPVYVQQDELDFAYAPPDDQRDIYVRADFDVGCDWRPLRRRPRPVRRRQRAHRVHPGPHRRPPVAARAPAVADRVPAVRRRVPRRQDAGAPAARRAVDAGGHVRDVGSRGGDRARARTPCCWRRTRSTTRRASASPPMPGTSRPREGRRAGGHARARGAAPRQRVGRVRHAARDGPARGLPHVGPERPRAARLPPQRRHVQPGAPQPRGRSPRSWRPWTRSTSATTTSRARPARGWARSWRG